MGQLAERVPVAQRKPQPVERRPPIAEARPFRSIAHASGFAEKPVRSPVSEIVGGLPAALRAGVEGLSGISMDDVRVHRNSSDPAKLGALAFTRGAEIHLGPGQEQHLPHEAWHVVQQKQGRVQATTQMKGVPVCISNVLEIEADKKAETLHEGWRFPETTCEKLGTGRLAASSTQPVQPKLLIHNLRDKSERFNAFTTDLKIRVMSMSPKHWPETVETMSAWARDGVNRRFASVRAAVSEAEKAYGAKGFIGPSANRNPQVTWSLLGPDFPGSVSDEQIYSYKEDAEHAAKEREAFETAKSEKMSLLKSKMKDWSPDDQEFASKLLGKVFQHSTNVDPRAVSDSNRQPILDRYEQWLRAVDQQRLKACADDPPGMIRRSRAAFRGDKPCLSWFSDKWSLGRSYASSKIEELRAQLRIARGTFSNAVDQVHWDVFLYRKETDPKMLQMQADAAEMVGGLSSLGSPPSGRPASVGALTGGKVAPKPIPENPVWVHLKNGDVKEFHPAEVRGSREVKAKVQTPDGPGVVVSLNEPPLSKAVKPPPDPNYVEPKLRPTPPKEPRFTHTKHHPSSKSPEPANVDELYRNSVEDLNGVRWAKDKDGTIHRFSKPSLGERHWNGSTGGYDPITPNEIPVEIKRLFGHLK